MNTYSVRATPTGYELTLRTPDGTTIGGTTIGVIQEEGGHGPIEKLYGLAARTWQDERSRRRQRNVEQQTQ
jgi:hypothetical protein